MSTTGRSTKSRGGASIPKRTGGERRQLVVVFSDLVGSSRIAHSLDPEEWREVLADYYDEINEAVTRYGGTVAKFVGDGVVALFGWPEAHENDAERAVRAALTIIGSTQQLNQRALGQPRPQIEVRLGIHRGEVVVDADGEIYGETPNIAARIQAEAAPNAVVVSDSIYREVSGSFATTDLGLSSLRGIAKPLHLYRLQGYFEGRRQRPRYDTGFVGRKDALAVLDRHWAQARRGRGTLVTLTGDAGIGKSRLVHEFRRRLALAQERHLWLETGCSPFLQNTAFAPVVTLFNRTIGRRSATPEAALSLLSALLRRSGADASATLPLIADMLGLSSALKIFRAEPASADIRRTQLLDALVGWAKRTASQRPTIILLEDSHWADPSSEDLMKRLADLAASSALLVLRTARTEAKTQAAAGARIVLDRLGEQDVRTLVADAVGSRLPAAAIEAIADRSNGVPLFAQELAHFVSADGGKNEVPATLAGLLNARLDQLGAARELAQLVAVVGQRASHALVRSLSAHDDGEFARLMTRLVDARILDRRGHGEQASYNFTHALVRDAAYESLLRTRRRDLHRQIADLLLTRFHELAARQPEVLARHLMDAGEHAKAADAWERIGHQAKERSAQEEALGAYEQALACLQSLEETPERDLKELLVRHAAQVPLQVMRGYSAAETIAATERAQALAVKLGNDSQLLSQTFGQWAALSSAGQHAQAIVLADRFRGLANADGRIEMLGNAGMMQMTSRYRCGDLVGALACFDDGRAAFDSEAFSRAPGSLAQTFGNASRILWMVGKADEAQDLVQRAIRAAELRNSHYDLAFAKYMGAILFILLREPVIAREMAEQSIAMSEQRSFPQFMAISRVVLGRALAELEQQEKGISLINAGIAGMKETRATVAMTMYLAWLAEAHAFADQRPAALAAIDEAFRFNPEERFFGPELFRIKGELRALTNRTDLAELDLRKAVTLSSDMGAVGLQLRAALSLHRLLRVQGTAGNIRELSAILHRLGDAHETLDTSEARDIVAASLGA